MAEIAYSYTHNATINRLTLDIVIAYEFDLSNFHETSYN